MMKFIVYVLCDKDWRKYKGVTNNLKRRLAEHRGGHTITTSKMKEIQLVYTEEFDTFEDARQRERYFKTAAGRRFLKIKLGR